MRILNILIHTVLPLIILIGIFLLTNRLGLGTDILTVADESFYLDSSFRIAQGDKYFYEVYTTMRGFDLYMSNIFIFFPDTSLLIIRYISLSIVVLSFAFHLTILNIVTKRLFFTWLLIPLCFFTPYNIFSLSYINLPYIFVINSISLLLLSYLTKNSIFSIIFAVLSAILALQLVFVYLPLMPVLPFVYTLILLTSRYFKYDDIFIKKIKIFMLAFILFSCMLLVVLFLKNILYDIIENIRITREAPMYGGNKFKALLIKILFAANRWYILIFVLVGLVGGFIYGRESHSRQKFYVLGFIFLLFSIFSCIGNYNASITQNFKDYFASNAFYVLAYVLLFAFAIGLFIQKLVNSREQNILFIIYAGTTTFFILIILLVSANSFEIIAETNWLGCIFLCYGLYLVNTKKLIPIYLFIILFAVHNYLHLHFSVYFQPNKTLLTNTFATPKLKGIYTEKYIVDFTDSLVSKIKILCPETNKDFVLFYSNANWVEQGYNLYGFNYLTNTRPPLKATIVCNIVSDFTMNKWLNQIKEENRIPKFVVANKEKLNNKLPLDKFITNNYTVIDSLKCYHILKNKNL